MSIYFILEHKLLISLATKRQQKPNLQVIRLEDGTKIRMSAREIRSLRKQDKQAA